MRELFREIRFAARSWRRQPGTAAAAITTLALASGASTAGLALFSAGVVRSAFPRPGSLVRLYDARRREGGESRVAVAARNFYEIRARARSFSSVAAEIYRNFGVPGRVGRERVAGAGVSDAWTETLGVRPAIGRPFSGAEERAGTAARVAIVSDGFWRTRMGSDPDLARRPLFLDGARYDVVGVMPRGYRYPYGVELWVPFTFDRGDGREHDLIVHARLARGATAASSAAELRRIAGELAAAYPESNAGFSFAVVPIADDMVEDRASLLGAFAGSVLLLLAIASADVAALCLTRAVGRRREMAVRRALGAGFGRIARQLGAENLLLCAFSAGAGVPVAFVLCRGLRSLLSNSVATVVETVAPDALSLAATAALAVLLAAALTALCLATLPAGADFLRGAEHRGAIRTLDVLVAGEIALSLVLLTAAALFGENFLRSRSARLGFDDRNLLTTTASVPPERDFAPAEKERLERRLVARLQALPGVRSAAAGDHLPLYVTNELAAVAVAGRPAPPRESPIVNHREVSPEYFETLGIARIRGRTFDSRDRADSLPVAVISRSMAERFWPGEDPIGRSLGRIRGGEPPRWRTVVGIVDDVREPRLAGRIRESMYVPASQSISRARGFDARQVLLAIRTDGPPSALAASVRRAIAEVDPGLSVYDVLTGAERRAETFAPERTDARLLTFFSAFGLLLAAVGTFGVLAYAVARRRKEIGVRAALGASPGDLLAHFLGRGARLVGAGVLAGAAASLVLSRILARLVPEVRAGDPKRLAAEIALLAAVGVAAAWVPARRASRLDPAAAIRED